MPDGDFQNPVPRAVRRQAARAEEIAQQIAEAAESGGDNAPPADPPVEASADPVTPPADPQEAAAAPAPAAPPADPPVDWEQRFRSLQGKYDAELPGLRQQVQNLEHLLATMQQAQAAPVQPRPATTTTVVIPDEEVAEYGAELIDAARRWARVELQGEFDKLRTELHELRAGQHQVSTETLRDRLERGLSDDPELANGIWERLNFDQNFIGWLHQVDDFAGVPRRQLFGSAVEQGDVRRVARFFKTYLAEHTASQPSPAPAVQTPSPADPRGGVADPRVSLEELAAPGRVNTPAGVGGGAPAEKRVWTTTEISRFYDDRRRGRYAGREAEATRTEQDIIDAAKEGRVR